MMCGMDGHDLLVRHAVTWAKGKRRPLDAGLLATALDLRTHQDERGDTYWPAGSVEHLMLRRWPAHGPAEVPDVEALASSLDTYVHFLRATGRMASGSADPKSLAKEARRAAPRMADACADPARHSQTKVLQAFGREIGIELDEVESMEDLQGRLDAVMEAWNALPEQERMARMPVANAAPGAQAARLNEALRGLVDRGVDLGALADRPGGLGGALAGAWGGFGREQDGADDVDAWGDGGADVPLAPSDPALSAADVRSSGFVRECLRLVEWVGAGPRGGRSVTKTGVLRLAEAEAAYGELGLREWLVGWSRAMERAEQRAGGQPMNVSVKEGFWWSNAGDCLPLDRLFITSQTAGLLETGRSRVMPGRVPAGDLDWVGTGAALVVALLRRVVDVVPLSPMVHILGTGVLEGGTVDVGRIREDWRRREGMGETSLPRMDPGEVALMPASDRARFDRLLYVFDDTGIWRRDGDTVTLTPFGRDVAIVVFTALDHGNLEL